MKQKFLLLISLVLIAVQGWAAPVDESSARTIVQDFVIEKRGINPNSLPTSGSSDLQLLHAEMSSVSVTMNAYYIYNTGDGFVIVAGDDRAERILGYGDEELDLNDIPCCMQFMLDSYKEQIDYLLEHPELEVETPSMNAPKLTAMSVAPMLTARWGQSEPYYNLTPLYNGKHCKTGCSCVALCQVMHYWKKPTTPVPSLPAYISKFRGVTIDVPELPSDRFHWNYIKDSYSGSYTADEAYSVAKLMRYAGQAMEMGYTLEASGASLSDILIAAKLFGYNRNAEVLDRDDYSDAEWAALIQAELIAGRPIVYCGFNKSHSVGHSFNIDGYRASDKKYHMNWGFRGNADGYYALNAFNPLNNNFNYMQYMIVGLEPQDPEIVIITPATLSFRAKTGETKTATFDLKGYALTGDLTVKLNNGGNIYSIDKTSITMSDAAYRVTVTVTYKPTEPGTSNASVTISGGGAATKTVSLNGTASAASNITTTPSSLSFSAYVGETKTETFTVKCPNAISNLKLTLNNGGSIYSIDKTSISKSAANSGVNVTVTYKPTETGTSNASITISGGGANPKTVNLSGESIKPEITVNPTEMMFNAYVGETKTDSFYVKAPKATGDLTVKLDKGGSTFSIDKSNITKNEAINGTTVKVTYHPTFIGNNIKAYITFSGGGADSKTVTLSGTALKPEITVTPSTLLFSAYTGETKTATFTVKCSYATEDLILQLNNGGNIYSIDKTRIDENDAINGTSVTVTYAPTEIGASTASITISGCGADSKTVSLSGTTTNPPSVIWVNPPSHGFGTPPNNPIWAGDTVKMTIYVKGNNLIGDLSVKLNDESGNYFINKTNICKDDAANGAEVMVTYSPKEGGTSTASVTISSDGAETKTVTFTGNAIKPEITITPMSLSFNSLVGETVIKKFIVKGDHLLSNITLTLNDESGNYSIDKTRISKSDAINGDTVTVSFYPTEAGISTANVIVSSGGYIHVLGAESKTVTLSGTAVKPKITISPSSLSFNALIGETVTKKFIVRGKDLLSNLTVVLNDESGNYSINKATISKGNATNGDTVTVTYKPILAGPSSAIVTISGVGAEPKTVRLSGVVGEQPIVDVNVNSVSIDPTYTGYEGSRTILITAANLFSDLQLSFSNDNSNSFALSQYTITPEDAAAGVPVTVYFYPTTGGEKHATLNIKSEGVETITIPVSGTGIKSDGYIFAWPTNLSFETQAGTPISQTFKVTYTHPNGSVMISSVGNDGETGFDAYADSKSTMPTLNATHNFSDLTREKIPFDSIILWRKEFIRPIEPVLIKSLVLELTGDDCFDITPSRIRLSSVPCSTYVTVTYNPECVGEHDANIKIWLFGGSARPFILHLHGNATASLNAPSYDNDGNDLMITQRGSSINTLMDEMLMSSKVYADGQMIIIESPVEQSAVISDIAGHAMTVNLQTGRNEIPVNSNGIYVVRIREKTTKLVIR